MKIKANTKLHMKKLKWLSHELENEILKSTFPTARARIILEICSVKSTKQFEQWIEGVR